MSVKLGILALLSAEPKHVYQLRAEFEDRTGGTWPLNIGQVYSTCQRLERDGLIVSLGMHDDAEQFELTAAGRELATQWWHQPVDRGTPARDELAIKVALAVTTPGVAVTEVLDRQRTSTMQVLQDYTKLSRNAAGDEEFAWQLVLDNLIFAAEAELRWLDHTEAKLARRGTGSTQRSGHPGAPARSESPAKTAAPAAAQAPAVKENK